MAETSDATVVDNESENSKTPELATQNEVILTGEITSSAGLVASAAEGYTPIYGLDLEPKDLRGIVIVILEGRGFRIYERKREILMPMAAEPGYKTMTQAEFRSFFESCSGYAQAALQDFMTGSKKQTREVAAEPAPASPVVNTVKLIPMVGEDPSMPFTSSPIDLEELPKPTDPKPKPPST